MNDTTRRFLTAVVERIPAGGRIVELRLFPAIRQGGVESGVAVVAVELPEGPELPDGPELPEASELPEGPEGAASGEDAPASPRPGEEEGADAFAVVAHDIVDIDVITEDEEGLTGDEVAAAASSVPLAAAEEEGGGEALDDELNDIVLDLAALERDATRDGSADVAPPPARPLRYAVLTARYRHTFKGLDRGKWDMEITHEADAPLDTVERVARGVAKRAGDESEPEQFSGASLREALEAPAWVTTP